MSLAPGDMAVITIIPIETFVDRLCDGLTVTLVKTCCCEICAGHPYPPYWACAGLPKPFHSVAERSLRKIPPAPMLEEEHDETGVTA